MKTTFEGNTLVTTQDGVQGRIIEASPDETSDRGIHIAFENGQRVFLHRDMLIPKDDGSYYIPQKLQELDHRRNASAEQHVLQVAEEQLTVERKEVETGRFRIQKQVETHSQLVDELLKQEHVQVKHIPVDKLIDRPVAIRQEGDTLIIPIIEEVLVVEKRLRLVEEVHIIRTTTEQRYTEEVPLRREHVVIEDITQSASQNYENSQGESSG